MSIIEVENLINMRVRANEGKGMVMEKIEYFEKVSRVRNTEIIPPVLSPQKPKQKTKGTTNTNAPEVKSPLGNKSSVKSPVSQSPNVVPKNPPNKNGKSANAEPVSPKNLEELKKRSEILIKLIAIEKEKKKQEMEKEKEVEKNEDGFFVDEYISSANKSVNQLEVRAPREEKEERRRNHDKKSHGVLSNLATDQKINHLIKELRIVKEELMREMEENKKLINSIEEDKVVLDQREKKIRTIRKIESLLNEEDINDETNNILHDRLVTLENELKLEKQLRTQKEKEYIELKRLHDETTRIFNEHMSEIEEKNRQKDDMLFALMESNQQPIEKNWKNIFVQDNLNESSLDIVFDTNVDEIICNMVIKELDNNNGVLINDSLSEEILEELDSSDFLYRPPNADQSDESFDFSNSIKWNINNEELDAISEKVMKTIECKNEELVDQQIRISTLRSEVTQSVKELDKQTIRCNLLASALKDTNEAYTLCTRDRDYLNNLNNQKLKADIEKDRIECLKFREKIKIYTGNYHEDNIDIENENIQENNLNILPFDKLELIDKSNYMNKDSSSIYCTKRYDEENIHDLSNKRSSSSNLRRSIKRLSGKITMNTNVNK